MLPGVHLSNMCTATKAHLQAENVAIIERFTTAKASDESRAPDARCPSGDADNQGKKTAGIVEF